MRVLFTLRKISFILLINLLSCINSNFTEPDYPNPQDLKPPGFLYILTDHPSKILRYNIDSQTLTNFVDKGSGIKIKAFAISSNGATLAFITSDSLLEVMNLSTGISTPHRPPNTPLNDVTVSSDGNLVVYQARSGLGTILQLLNIPANTFSDITTNPLDSSRAVVFSRGEFFLAWAQRTGVFLLNLSTQSREAIQLNHQPMLPLDFSPLGSRLITNQTIFDLVLRTPLPLQFKGEARFLDEDHFILQKEETHTFILSDLSGINQTKIAGPFPQKLPFCVDPSGRFLAYFVTSDSTNSLKIYKVSEKRSVIEKDFPVSEIGTVVKVIWREIPPLSGEDG